MLIITHSPVVFLMLFQKFNYYRIFYHLKKSTHVVTLSFHDTHLYSKLYNTGNVIHWKLAWLLIITTMNWVNERKIYTPILT